MKRQINQSEAIVLSVRIYLIGVPNVMPLAEIVAGKSFLSEF